MNFFQFAFSFLYTRNWHTGQRELSRVRVYFFVCGLILLAVAIAVIMFLQAPVEVFVE